MSKNDPVYGPDAKNHMDSVSDSDNANQSLDEIAQQAAETICIRNVVNCDDEDIARIKPIVEQACEQAVRNGTIIKMVAGQLHDETRQQERQRGAEIARGKMDYKGMTEYDNGYENACNEIAKAIDGEETITLSKHDFDTIANLPPPSKTPIEMRKEGSSKRVKVCRECKQELPE